MDVMVKGDLHKKLLEVRKVSDSDGNCVDL